MPNHFYQNKKNKFRNSNLQTSNFKPNLIFNVKLKIVKLYIIYSIIKH